MRAISLHQPFASAVAVGAKTIETRHWQTDYRGPLAIHASKTKQWLGGMVIGAYPARSDRWIKAMVLFAKAGITKNAHLPLGKVVAVCELYNCVPVESVRRGINEVEELFGNYADGRFAWMLRDIKPITCPFECVGRQRFFNVDDALIESALGLTAQMQKGGAQ